MWTVKSSILKFDGDRIHQISIKFTKFVNPACGCGRGGGGGVRAGEPERRRRTWEEISRNWQNVRVWQIACWRSDRTESETFHENQRKRAIDFQIPLKLISSIKILNYFNNIYLFEENRLLVSKVNTVLNLTYYNIYEIFVFKQ
jgi:hypothetical protein